MRFREILSVAILGVALTDAAGRADTPAWDSAPPPTPARIIPGTNDSVTADWGDAYSVAGATVDGRQYSAFSDPAFAAAASPALDRQPLAGGETVLVRHRVVADLPPHVTPAPVHPVPLPPTVWSGAVLLAASAIVVWARKRRHAGELVAS
jgi:hypothetical protein